MIESLLLTATQISTFAGGRLLTKASGFFFARDERLYLVTSRHVLRDVPSGHQPDRIRIELHVDAQNLTRSTGFSVPLYRDGQSLWRQGTDTAGEIDVAVIEQQQDESLGLNCAWYASILLTLSAAGDEQAAQGPAANATAATGPGPSHA